MCISKYLLQWNVKLWISITTHAPEKNCIYLVIYIVFWVCKRWIYGVGRPPTHTRHCAALTTPGSAPPSPHQAVCRPHHTRLCAALTTPGTAPPSPHQAVRRPHHTRLCAALRFGIKGFFFQRTECANNTFQLTKTLFNDILGIRGRTENWNALTRLCKWTLIGECVCVWERVRKSPEHSLT